MSKSPYLVLMTCANRWKNHALNCFYEIEGWRDAQVIRDPDSNEQREHRKQAASKFHLDTSILVSAIASEHRNLDAEPFKRLYELVSSWDENPMEARELLPPQRELAALMDRAAFDANAIESDQYARERLRLTGTDNLHVKPSLNDIDKDLDSLHASRSG